MSRKEQKRILDANRFIQVQVASDPRQFKYRVWSQLGQSDVREILLNSGQ